MRSTLPARSASPTPGALTLAEIPSPASSPPTQAPPSPPAPSTSSNRSTFMSQSSTNGPPASSRTSAADGTFPSTISETKTLTSGSVSRLIQLSTSPEPGQEQAPAVLSPSRPVQ